MHSWYSDNHKDWVLCGDINTLSNVGSALTVLLPQFLNSKWCLDQLLKLGATFTLVNCSQWERERMLSWASTIEGWFCGLQMLYLGLQRCYVWIRATHPLLFVAILLSVKPECALIGLGFGAGMCSELLTPIAWAFLEYRLDQSWPEDLLGVLPLSKFQS